MDEDWLSSRATAKRIGVHVGTLRRWANESPPPEDVAFQMRGKLWRWTPDMEAIRRWVAGLSRTP